MTDRSFRSPLCGDAPPSVATVVLSDCGLVGAAPADGSRPAVGVVR